MLHHRNGGGKQGCGNRPPINDRAPIRKFSIFCMDSANRRLPLPFGRRVCETMSKKGAPDTENPSLIGFTVLGGGLRPWSQTMVSEGARPWGRGRSEFAKGCLQNQQLNSTSTDATEENQREKPIRNFRIDPASSIRTSLADTVFADVISETPNGGLRAPCWNYPQEEKNRNPSRKSPECGMF